MLGMAIAYTFVETDGQHRETLRRTWPSDGGTYEDGLSHGYVETAKAFTGAVESESEVASIDVDEKFCEGLGRSMAAFSIDRARAITSAARLARDSPRTAGVADSLADIRAGYEMRLIQHLDVLGAQLANSESVDAAGSRFFVLLATAALKPSASRLDETGRHWTGYQDSSAADAVAAGLIAVDPNDRHTSLTQKGANTLREAFAEDRDIDGAMGTTS